VLSVADRDQQRSGGAAPSQTDANLPSTVQRRVEKVQPEHQPYLTLSMHCAPPTAAASAGLQVSAIAENLVRGGPL